MKIELPSSLIETFFKKFYDFNWWDLTDNERLSKFFNLDDKETFENLYDLFHYGKEFTKHIKYFMRFLEQSSFDSKELIDTYTFGGNHFKIFKFEHKDSDKVFYIKASNKSYQTQDHLQGYRLELCVPTESISWESVK